ncbi:hypothetical protein QUA62_24910 [Microcoleus sp. MON1_C1]|uniref:hypothetical protein n=1 Tax=Microcoleus sp. MON1_C1 TaxID=2818827 RepID=UPI002FCEF0E2
MKPIIQQLDIIIAVLQNSGNFICFDTGVYQKQLAWTIYTDVDTDIIGSTASAIELLSQR